MEKTGNYKYSISTSRPDTASSQLYRVLISYAHNALIMLIKKEQFTCSEIGEEFNANLCRNAFSINVGVSSVAINPQLCWSTAACQLSVVMFQCMMRKQI